MLTEREMRKLRHEYEKREKWWEDKKIKRKKEELKKEREKNERKI